MERIKREEMVKYEYFRSWDGVVFRTEEECLQHENSPTVKAWKGVQSCLLRKATMWKMFSVFDLEDESPVYIFRPTNHDDIKALNTYLNTSEYGVRNVNRLNDLCIGKDIFVICSYTKTPYLMDELVTKFKKSLKYILNTDETDSDYDEEEEKIIRNR